MKFKNQKGYALLVALVFLAIFSILSSIMIGYSVQYNKTESYAVASSQALNLAEAAIDHAFYQLNQNSSYIGESDIPLGNGTFTISVASIDSNTKSITGSGYVPNSTNPIAYRTIKVNANVGQSVISFRYGIQVGNGGFTMLGGSTLNGSVYSNGNISATNGVHITGAAVAANPPALASDQVNNTPIPISSCGSSTCINFANLSATEDFAQSFKVSSAVPLNNIQFYIKKISNPGDATVRIVTNNAGSPSAVTLMSGTLSAAAVTTSFGWVSVTMPSTPVLDPAQTYWMVIDASSNASKYYVIGANSNGYSLGTAKIGKYNGSWSATSPSGLDGYFQIYLGGGTSMIGGNTYATGVYVGSTVSDDAWAHTVIGATVTGTIYCQVGSYTNKACNTSKADPTPQPMPFSDSNIQEWKDDAESGGTISGDYHVDYAGATLGPKKITGNLLIDGGGTLTVSGTIWVQGTITLAGGGKVKLASSYGANSGAIISDNYITLAGNSNFAGSGQAGSYPFLITTSACPAAAGCGGNNAISLSGGAGTVALVAQNGNVIINGGSSLKEVTAKQVTMSGGATLYYDSGLISENFSSGPGGSWQFVPGTYTITH
jgi:type II secretory pathway pseudopilin PulG